MTDTEPTFEVVRTDPAEDPAPVSRTELVPQFQPSDLEYFERLLYERLRERLASVDGALVLTEPFTQIAEPGEEVTILEFYRRVETFSNELKRKACRFDDWP